MDNIKDIRAKRPEWANLSDDSVVNVLRQTYYPDLTNEQLAQEIGATAAKSPEASRTWGQAAADTGRAVASGVGGLVKSGGTLYGMATGDMDNGATELGESVQKYWEDGQSHQLKAKKAVRSQAIDNADGVLGKAGTALWETISDPALAADTVASNIATLIPGAVVGRVAAGANAARGLAAASKFGPASMAAREAVGKAAGTLGTRAAIGVGALQQGADVSGDVYESAMKKPDAVWANNPEFMTAFGQTDGSEKAWQDTKQAFALSTARATMPAATAISVGANMLPGADMLERALVGGAAKNTLKAGGKLATAKAMGKGALGEMGQETIEEGGGAFAGNVAKQQIIDDRQDLGENVGENAGMGAAGGLLMGGAGGAFHGTGHTAIDPALAIAQAQAEQAARAKVAAVTAAHAAAQTPNSPLSRAAAAANPLPAAPVVPGAAAALTPEQIEAEISRLDTEAKSEANQPVTQGPQAPAATNSVAQEDPIAETQRLIDEGRVQAAADKARQHAANRLAERPTITDPLNGSEVTGDDPRYDMVRAATGMDNAYTGMPAMPVRPAAPAPDTTAAAEAPDPMYQSAVEVVKATGRPSIALVQRHLKIGYNRAARLLEDMEFAGLVSPAKGDGLRTMMTPPADAGIPASVPAADDQPAAIQATPQDAQDFYDEGTALIEDGRQEEGRQMMARGDAILAALEFGPEPAPAAPAPVLSPADNADDGVLDGDKLSQSGKPFNQEGAAKVMLRQHPGHELAKLRSGWVIRPQAAAAPADQDQATERLKQDARNVVVRSTSEAGRSAIHAQLETGIDSAVAAGASEETIFNALHSTGNVADNLAALLPSKETPVSTSNEVIAQAAPAQLATETVAPTNWNPVEAQKEMGRQEFVDAATAEIKAKREARGQTAFSKSGENSELTFRQGAGIAWDNASAARASLPAPAASVAGPAIDQDWSAFTPESGTLNVPRAEMPQIKAEHRGPLVNFLKARGIESQADEVPADSLKPTQAEFSPEKVSQAQGFTGPDRSILVSSDGYVLDGHHQMMAKREAGKPVKVIRLDAPIDALLSAVREFPSATQAEGATAEPTDNSTAQDLKTVEGVARAIQIRVATRRKAALKKFREEAVAKRRIPNSTPESEQAGFDKEISTLPGDRGMESAANFLGTDPLPLIGMFVNGNFEASEDVFKDMTGVKIRGLSAAAKKAALYQWANWTPEQIAKAEQDEADQGAVRKAKFVLDELKTALASDWRGLGRLGVKDGDTTVTGQQFVLQTIAKGFDQARSNKKGAITSYGLSDGVRFTTLKNKDFGSFIKNAMALGGIDKALAYVNPAKPQAPEGFVDRSVDIGSFATDADKPANTTDQQAPAATENVAPTAAASAPAPESAPAPAPAVEVAPPAAPAANQKALDRIAKGTAYFGTMAKAIKYMQDNDLKGTHEVVRHESGANRFDIRARAATAASPAQPDVSTKAPELNTSAGPVQNRAETEQVVANMAGFEGAYDPNTDSRMPGPSGYSFPSNQLVIRIQQAFESQEVQATAIGNTPEGFVNFGRAAPDGRFYITSQDSIIAFDGQGQWKMSSGPAVGKYDTEQLESEIIRVLTLQGAKPAVDSRLVQRIRSDVAKKNEAQAPAADAVVNGKPRPADTTRPNLADIAKDTRQGLAVGRISKEEYDAMQAAAARAGEDALYSSKAEIRQPKTLDEFIGAVDAGYRAHFDYAGENGNTVWIEKVTDSEGYEHWVLKDREDDASVTYTKGGGMARWAKFEAMKKAEQVATFRFTEWKPEAATPPATAPMANVLKAAQDSGKLQIISVGDKPKATATEPFDSAKFDGERDERVKASRKAGYTHLDKVPAYVESMRGKAIEYVHDPKVRGVIRTVANTGDVVVHWSDAYSAKKELATKTLDGKKEVWQTSLMPSDLKDYRLQQDSKAEPATPMDVQQTMTGAVSVDGLSNAEVDQVAAMFADKPKAAPAPEPKTDELADKERAAKTKMLNAAAKLAQLLSKNTRMNITPEQEQAMLPIVIELFDGAMELGYVKFKQAARYVREFLANAIDQEAADAIPIDTLQGAYIATARRHQDKAVTPKSEVVTIDSIADLAEDTEQGIEETGNNVDTEASKDTNATSKLDSASARPLEGTPAIPVQGTVQDGAVADGTGAGSRANADGTGKTDGPGLQVPGSLGNGAGAVPVPSRGTGRKRGSSKQPGVPGDAGLQPGIGFSDAAGGIDGLIPVNPAPNAAPIPAPAFALQDFTIEEDFALGEGGEKAKFKGNVEAIRLISQLDAEQRAATPAEQAVLARYVGWGALAQAFDVENQKWAKEYAELKQLMSEDDYADAARSTRYAHYTSRQVIQDGIYAALKHMGFNGGRALEGGAGVGNFIGLMPADMRSASRFTAIEREPFSAKIAKHLYPQQNVQEADFTQFIGNDDYYDVAVGNPPFAADPQVDQSGRKHLSGLSLHNYFFAKAVDMLREGGILAQVVTNSFLDAATDTARTYISDKTRFLGAIRLPNNAFSKNAGTEVTTDLIFLQKRPESEWGGKAAKLDAKRWLGVGKYEDATGATVPLNQYFIDHPDMMLGKFGAYGTMYRGGSSALVANAGQDTAALLKDAVSRLPAAVYVDKAITNTAAMQDALVKTLSNPQVQEGGYFEEDGKLFQRIRDVAGEARGKEITPLSQWTEKTKLGDAGFARIQSLSGIRATLRDLLAAELRNDTKMDALRQALNTQYDAYAKAHGLINDPATLRVFDDDPDFPLLASLEHGYTPAIGAAAAKTLGIKLVPSSAKKGPIFTRRVIDARQQVVTVETPADALAVSMAERGKLDTAYIGELLGRDSDEVLQELSSGDKPLLFKDPATGEYALRDAYLSGNVRAKLVQAKQSGMFSNILALERVQPEDVGAHEIVARVGSPWVPVSVYEDFAKMLLGEGTDASVRYVKATAGFSAYMKAGSDTANTNTWGISEFPATSILSALLNNKPVKVTWTDKEGTHTDVDATERANAKAQDMRNKFQDWLFADGDRAELLGRAYNDTNNNYVTREFDGEWMTFPGKVPNEIVKFRRHQRNAIARIVQDRTVLLDHVVGSGKTYSVIAAAMELRRTGLARKPMIAVPNHLVKQWASDFYKLYPGANILTATKKDFEKTNRRKFLAKIATGDWDAVIIAHSSFGFIKPSPEFEHQFNNKQVASIMATIREVEEGDGDKQQKKRTVKQLEGIKERLENRIKALRDKPMDALLDFGELGVDQLFVDEAHCFPADAVVTTENGAMRIGDIVENRLNVRVLSVNSSTSAQEWKSVINWYANRQTHIMVRVLHQGGSFDCTANHNIWTYEEGFIAAGNLKPHHTLRAETQGASAQAGMQDVRALRGGVQLQVVGQGEQRQTPVLHGSLCGDVADDAAAHQGEDRSSLTGGPSGGGAAQARHEVTGIGAAHAGQKPHGQRGDTRQDGSQPDGANLPGAGRQWCVDAPAAGAARCVRLSDGARHCDGASEGAIPLAAELLQGGPGRPGAHAGDRGGRQHAQAAQVEISGRAQDGGAERSRVVGVEVLESGSGPGFAQSAGDDSRVYCLEVADNHNFFVGGVLVSNSFKNLMYSTKMQNVAGLGDAKGSQRAYDIYVKANQIYAKNGRGQGVVFATGTPVSNSLAEMYHMMRYLMPAQMEDMGFQSFDAWANTYASVEQVWMQKASGDGFKAQNRMSNFVNTPELLKVFDQVSDTVTMDDIKAAYREENDGEEFPLPRLKDGKRTPVSLRKSKAQESYMAAIAQRALIVENRKGPPEKGQDNILVIMSDARKAAMDVRLVDPDITEREPGGRIDRSSQEIFARYKQYDAEKGTQIVFSDLGTPLKTAKKELAEYQALKDRIETGAGAEVMQRAALGDEAAQDKVDDAEDAQNELDAKGRDWLGAMQAAERGFSVYDDLKAALMEKGIPEKEIAFIHDYNTDEQKAGLFRKMNAGQIRVLVGSTPKLGAGTNVQERLVALHHLDVPWKPSDVEQREGRIIRQGNLFGTPPTEGKPNPHYKPDFEVEVLAYVTQDTLDMRMWQVQETKLKMINQLRTRNIGREVENAFEDLELSAGEMQAAATGNIDLLREIQIKGEMKKLEQRKRAFDAQKSDLQNRKKSVAQKLATLPDKIAKSAIMAGGTDEYQVALDQVAAAFSMTVNGQTYTDSKEVGKVLLGHIDAHVFMQRQENGKYGGTQLKSQAEVAAAYEKTPADKENNTWDKRPVPLSVEMNGVTYTSREKLAEAFSNERGDKDPIVWNFAGEQLVRRTLIENAIRSAVAESVAEKTIQEVGNIGPFAVSVEGQTSRKGSDDIEIVLSYKGQTLSNSVWATENSTASVIRVAENLALSARQQHTYEQRQLAQAEKDKAELDTAQDAGEWPEQGKLEELRLKHKDVLRRLSGAGVTMTADGETLQGDMGMLSAQDDTDVVFSRATGRAASLPLKQVQAIVSTIEASWENSPRIVVVQDMNDAAIPERVRGYNEQQKSLGATGEPDGFVYGGKVYLLAGQLASPADVLRVLFHEALGHTGLRGAFGQGLKQVLNQVVLARRADVVAKARQYGLDPESPAGLLHAAEEVLAEMAQAHPELGLVKRAIAAIRAWLRDNIPGFDKMALTDDMIIQQFILPARRFIEGGGPGPKGGQPVPAFSRGQAGQANPDIRFSRSQAEAGPRTTLSAYSKTATDKLNEVFSHPGKLSLWDKTVGSQYHLAERSPTYKKVFDAAQDFINDVSFYANEAANLAPKILPRMENWRDLAKTPVSSTDNKAIAAPLLQGTLNWARDEDGKAVLVADLKAKHNLLPDEDKAQMLLRKRLVTEDQLKRWKGSPLDIYAGAVNNRFAAAFQAPGIVWTDAELRDQFTLDPAQIGLYREFRAATDKSLDNMAKSDLLRFGGKDVADLRELVMEAKDADEAAVLLRDYLLSLAGADLTRKVELTDSANGMIDRADKVNKLKARGYAPLSRFGKYTVDVVVDGERQYFSLFETMADANKMAARMREEFGHDSVAQGTLSQKEFEQFQGITPESLELFGNMMGLDSTGDEAQDKAFQTYIKLTKTNRSAMKRLIHRQGTAGFSEEMGRVLASFVYSNARQTSAALHLGTLGEAVNDIPKGQGELKDHAIRLSSYIRQPQEEAHAFRALMFAQYLGGSVASAAVNFTQPFTVTFPYLSQFGGAAKSGAALIQAMKDQKEGKVLESGLAQALHHAEEDGVVSPQAVHELQAQAQGRAALRSGDGTRRGDAIAATQNGLSKLALGWGKLFGLAEQVNRRSTFIAAYRVAVAHKPVLQQELASATGDQRANVQRRLAEIADPKAFAYKAVNDTQFISNKANKARFARGPIGGTLMTFKSYSTNYLELLHRLATQSGPEGKQAMALMLAMLFLMAGAGGMPGADDLDDIADFLAQRLGYNWSSKQAKQQFLDDLFGKTLSNFIDKGITGLPGAPLDVSGRMGMGNLLPGTGLLLQKRDHTGDLKELFGPAGDMLQRGFTAADQFLSGDFVKSALTVAPKSVGNWAKGIDMGRTGMYKDAKGYKVIDTTPAEAALKFAGFQPATVARVQEANYMHQRTKDFYSLKSQEINARWAKGIYEKDQGQVDKARSMIADWNMKNPSEPMHANMAAIVQRVKQMRLSKDARIAATAPKALKAQFRKDLAEAQAERNSN